MDVISFCRSFADSRAMMLAVCFAALCACLRGHSQRVLGTHMGNTYPNHEGNYYYRNHTFYHVGTLDPLGLMTVRLSTHGTKLGPGIPSWSYNQFHYWGYIRAHIGVI